MTETLLKELSNSDIEWAVATGKKQEIARNTVLFEEENTADSFHILLEGTLSVKLAQRQNNPLADAFATLEGKDTASFEITRLSRGEIIGENALIGLTDTGITIKALEKCLLLSIPVAELKIKSDEDKEFAARFYRAIATLYLNRLQSLLDRLGRINFSQSQPVRDILYIFGQLHDSDLDWAISNGSVQQIPAQTDLIRQGGPVDALYFLLDGQMSVFFETNQNNNPLTNIFATLEGKKSSGKEIAKLYKGEIIGEAPFIDARLPYATVKAVDDSLVLALARPILIAKLQQDIGFAARFYQAISTLLAHKLEGIVNRLSIGRRTYDQGQSLRNGIQYVDEIDEELLEQISLAATRFNWMLERLQVRI